jgi:hypothetical protein
LIIFKTKPLAKISEDSNIFSNLDRLINIFKQKPFEGIKDALEKSKFLEINT